LVTRSNYIIKNPGGGDTFMANTYSQITIHAVFAVKYRENFIIKDWRDNLHQYISGTITNKGAKSLAVGGWKDHVHILFGMPVTTSIADFVGAVKANSSK
jgi:putative transposase